MASKFNTETFNQENIDQPSSSKKIIKKTLLIGEDQLVIKCAEILIKNEYLLIAIISPNLKIRGWATQNNILYFESLDEAKIILLHEKINYLFSIVNSQILPDELINKISEIAVNYHYSPLPQYAGVNSTSWAIINNESTHGVTWHVINSMIDGGEIIKQTTFKINELETALTLNHKCHQYALAQFKILIKDLNNNKIKKIKQDKKRRSYFSLSSKPEGNGAIDWNQSAENIDRYFRALYLGTYDNTLTVLKIKICNTWFIVSELKMSTALSTKVPGTIIEMTPDYWHIATATKDIIISKIATLYGRECSLNKLAKFYKLNRNTYLRSDTPLFLEQFRSFSVELSRYEQFWVSQLIQFKPAELPFLNDTKVNTKQYDLITTNKIPFSLIQTFQENFDETIKLEEIVLTIWLIYLYRIGNKKNLGVGLNYSEAKKFANFESSFSSQLPFSLQFNDKMTFADTLKLVSQQIKIVRSKKTFLKDIFYRYQALTKISSKIPISIVIENDTAGHAKVECNSSFLLKISVAQKSVSWYLKKGLMRKNPKLTKIASNSAHHFNVLIEATKNNPQQFISKLPILTLHEKKQLIFEKNDTNTTYPQQKNIGEVLLEAFDKFPNNVAIQSKDLLITYEEFYNKVCGVMSYLTEKGVKFQEPVIVYMPQNYEWVITAVAIIMLGAIYIPIVDSTPLKRVKIILKDAQAKFILSQKDFIKKKTITFNSLIKIIDISIVLKFFPLKKTVVYAHAFSSDSIAYLLYTSGTTGTPKGVMIKHYSLVNLMMEQIKSLNLDINSRVLQFAPIGFDASIWEIFATFLAGGVLCLPLETTLLIGETLTEAIKKFKVTHITLPPSILQTVQSQKITSLKTVITAGESCSRELADKWINKVTLINAYGPTETTVCATMGVIPQTNNITIGYPIANTQIYILDQNLEIVPEGVTGEIYIGGDCVAIGYYQQEKLTNLYFIQNPFQNTPGEKIYKTRDLARWLPEGSIEYIGRIDNQLKIRGLRIEPKAIEAQILHYKYINQCVVVLQQTKNLEIYIVAYLVLTKKIDLHALRSFLNEHLPNYMLPNFFVTLEKIPLTINGKIDRNALPIPNQDEELKNYTPPSSSVERRLCQIWKNILRLEKVGIENDFFTIGGNSLLLSQLIIKLREEFDFDMHFSVVLKNPTIASLANLINKKLSLNIKEIEEKEMILSDAKLSKEIQPISKSFTMEKSNSVLLTGATGLLGSHLLRELHSNTKLKIYCLIRADSKENAKILLEKIIFTQNLTFSLTDRVIPVLGDLSAPLLGLDPATYTHLAQEIDEIYHNAAFVHHLYSYKMLRAANVGSTLEILRLASESKNKKIYYISTLSALSNFIDTLGYIKEEFISKKMEIFPLDGYNQTKWVSEKLLAQAVERGFVVKIYRPGLILNHKTNSTSSNNHFLRLIKGCIEMGYAPNWNIALNLLPAEFLSNIIVKVALCKNLESKVFNFSSPYKVTWLNIINYLNDLGYKIELVSKENWLSKAKKIKDDNSLFNLLPLYTDNDMEIIFNQGKFANDQNTQRELKNFQEYYPVLNKDFLAKFFNFLMQGTPTSLCEI